jgi:maleylacetoacetate isomerase
LIYFIFSNVVFLFRWKINLTNHPLIISIEEKLDKNDAFKAAHPNQQPDCPEEEKA